MSEIRARASRRAFCLGSWTRNGFTGRNGPVWRLPGALVPIGAGEGAGGAAAGDGAGGAGGAGRANGAGGAAGATRTGGGAGGAGGAGGTRSAGGGTTGLATAPEGRATGGIAGGATGDRRGPAGRATVGAAVGRAPLPSALTAKMLLHTLQRARTPPGGTLVGCTRCSCPRRSFPK